ncbi:MAG: phosphotransferase [Anaerolineales bacterium]|nr:phosphotransferase [Anaerolineales bacterium]
MGSESVADELNVTWTWPFGKGDLTAGLRRSLGDLSLQVTEVRPITIARRRPSIGVLRGLQVNYIGQNGEGSCQLVVKEPRGTTRTGLAGAGKREVGVYQFLSTQLPLFIPTLIAASPSGDWLLLEAVPPIREASVWNRNDYLKAIDSLAQLHDRFWNLGEDLNAYPWLSRPLTADFDVHAKAAVHAIDKIQFNSTSESSIRSPRQIEVLRSLAENAEVVTRPLLREPSTLLHGDYWPGNISVMKDGSQIVYDWQLTAIGPAVLDLMVFIKKSLWWFDSIPMTEDEIVQYYRERLQLKSEISWEQDRWDEIWDHALMWRFLQEWVDILAASPEPILTAREDQLEEVWLEPVVVAAKRRLNGE